MVFDAAMVNAQKRNRSGERGIRLATDPERPKTSGELRISAGLLLIVLAGGLALAYAAGLFDGLLRHGLPKKTDVVELLGKGLAETVQACQLQASRTFSGVQEGGGSLLGLSFGGATAEKQACVLEQTNTLSLPALARPTDLLFFEGSLEAGGRPGDDVTVLHVGVEWIVRSAEPLDRAPIEAMLAPGLPDLLACSGRHVFLSTRFREDELPLRFFLLPEGRAEGVSIGQVTDTTSPYRHLPFADCVKAVMEALPLPQHDATTPIQVMSVLEFDVTPL